MEGISIVIPVYNEAESLETFLPELHHCCQSLSINWEVIVVNDGSTDNSQEILQENSWIKVITHSQRQGYGSALKDGIRATQFKYVCFIDGDSSYHPSLIQAGLIKLDRLDIVIGARDEKSADFPPLTEISPLFYIQYINCGIQAQSERYQLWSEDNK